MGHLVVLVIWQMIDTAFTQLAALIDGRLWIETKLNVLLFYLDYLSY
jgi:hypothetical protein